MNSLDSAPVRSACSPGARVTLALTGLLAAAGCTSTLSPTPTPRDVVRLDPPAAPGAMAPNWAAGGGEPLLSWLEPRGEGHALTFSRLDASGRWGDPGTVAASERLVVNWADFPSIARAVDGSLVAHWLERSGSGSYQYDVQLARSPDAGRTWIRLGPAHDDGVKAEHGFVSLLPGPDGVRVVWLDGRQTGSDGDHTGHGEAGGAMTLRTALLAGGAGAGPGELLDERVCDCCQTAAVLTATGPVVAYRDRSEAEIRDISIIRETAGAWTGPVPAHRDGWEVPGCPVNGPVLASDMGGRQVAVAWFTAEGNRARVQVAFSSDAGARFGSPLTVDASRPIGRVGLVLTSSGEAIVSWLAGTEGEGAEVRLRRVSRDGRVGRAMTVTATTSSRASGFPRLARQGDDLLVAWTEPGASSNVRAARLPVSLVPEASERLPAIPSPPTQARPWDRQPGSRAPVYSARTPEGETVALEDLKGSPVLLNLWATWCAPCREEIPHLVALHRRHASQGLRLVGVSVDVDLAPERIRAFADEAGIPYTILHDPEDRASGLFLGQQVLPASFLFDRDGVLVWSRAGVLGGDDAVLDDAIRKALGDTGS